MKFQNPSMKVLDERMDAQPETNKPHQLLRSWGHNYSIVENMIFQTNLLPRLKYPMLSYPTHFLKIGVDYFGLIFFRMKYGDPKL